MCEVLTQERYIYKEPEGTDLFCPLCSTNEMPIKMDYKQYKETHVWICPDCPGILFEYLFPHNVNELDAVIHRDYVDMNVRLKMREVLDNPQLQDNEIIKELYEIYKKHVTEIHKNPYLRDLFVNGIIEYTVNPEKFEGPGRVIEPIAEVI
jgi:hypothetical protein